MARLWDDLLLSSGVDRQTQKNLMDSPRPVVVVADNVARYVFDAGIGSEDWKEFSNLAPPFRNFFIEARLPSNAGEYLPQRFGMHVLSSRGEEARAIMAAHAADYKAAAGGDISLYKEDEIEWELFIILYLDYKGSGVIGPAFVFPLALNARGEQCNVTHFGKMGMFGNGTVFENMASDMLERGISPLSAIAYPLYTIGFMSIMFMHTKNVDLIEEQPPRKLSRKHQKKYGKPLTSFHVIRVNPMNNTSQDSAGDSTRNNAISPRLHICRGHFKDYRFGAGLFGKYQDIFWWDQHIRGDASMGEIEHEYDVEAPSNASS